MKTHPSHTWNPNDAHCAVCDAHVLSFDAKWPCKPDRTAAPSPRLDPDPEDDHADYDRWSRAALEWAA